MYFDRLRNVSLLDVPRSDLTLLFRCKLSSQNYSEIVESKHYSVPPVKSHIFAMQVARTNLWAVNFEGTANINVIGQLL